MSNSTSQSEPLFTAAVQQDLMTQFLLLESGDKILLESFGFGIPGLFDKLLQDSLEEDTNG